MGCYIRTGLSFLILCFYGLGNCLVQSRCSQGMTNNAIGIEWSSPCLSHGREGPWSSLLLTPVLKRTGQGGGRLARAQPPSLSAQWRSPRQTKLVLSVSCPLEILSGALGSAASVSPPVRVPQKKSKIRSWGHGVWTRYVPTATAFFLNGWNFSPKKQKIL